MADTLGLLFKITANSSQATSEIKGLRNTISSEVNQIKKISNDGFGSAEKSALSMGSSFATAGIAIAAVGTLAVAAASSLFALVKSASDAGSQIYDLSVKTGFTAESLSALKNAGEASGVSFESIAAGLGIFEKNMTAAAQGNAKMSATFKALNIDTKNNEQALRDVFTVLSRMPDGAEKTAAAMQLFGRAGKEVLGIIDDTNGSLDQAIEKYRQLGTLIDTQAAAAADKFGDQLTELQQQLAGVAREIGMELMPMVSKSISEISTWLRENKNTVKEWATTFTSAITGLAKIVGPIIKGLIDTLGALNAVMKLMKGDKGGGFAWLEEFQKVAPGALPPPTEREDADLTGKTLGVKGAPGLGGLGAAIFRTRAAVPEIHLPDLTRGGKEKKEKKGPDDFGLDLLNQLREQTLAAADATNVQRTALELLDEKYKGLNSTLRNLILTEAANKDRVKETIEATEKQRRVEQDLADDTRNLIEQQTRKIEGDKSEFELVEAITARYAAQGRVLNENVLILLQLNALQLDWIELMKTTKELDIGGIFGGMVTPPDKDSIGTQIEAMLGAPPAMAGVAQQIDIFKELGTVLSDTLGLGAEQAEAFGNILANVFGQVADAVGEAVGAFIKFGSVQGGFKKFAVEVIASIAQMSVVQALFEVAQALAMMALTYFTGNPKYAQSAGAHWAAAAAFGLIGGVATVAGRGLAVATGYGQDSKESGAAAGGALRSSVSGTGTSGGGATATPIDVGRRVSNEQAVGDLTIKVDLGDGHIENKIVRIFQGNGRLRTELRRDMLGERSPG